MDSVSIGLDIGSSAVRAAEVEIKDGRRVLRSYAQVGIPNGYIVEGEVVNMIGVAEALRRLWTEGGFTSNKVILGVSGPRVFVRQAEVPAMNKDDLISSLRFDTRELVPIPLDESSFDVSVLDADAPNADGEVDGKHMRILLVAAHREVLRSYLQVLKQAGLEAVAMDSSALALMRAVPTAVAGGSGVEALVSIGADLTTVAVRQGGVPLFIRTLTVGGSKLTNSLASGLHLEMAMAERLKRRAVPADTPQLSQVRKSLGSDIRDLAEDIRATIDFFAVQAHTEQIEYLLLTGGASQTEGLAAAVGGNMPLQVMQIAPFAGLDVSRCGLSEEELARASAGATTAIGLALWPHDAPLIRLSILPEEVGQARRARRLLQTAAVSVAGLIGLLGLAGGAKVLQVHSAQNQAKAAQRQVVLLTGQVSKLQAATAVHGQMIARAQMDVTALTGDVDWDRVLGQLAAVMPPKVHILTFSGTRTASTSTASLGGAAGASVGTVTFAVTGTGDAKTAAAWLDGLQRDPDFAGSWVSGITITGNGQTVSFASNSFLTTTSQSTRAEAAKP